jgi:RimJ/RimL family protein N-acetyltransferase
LNEQYASRVNSLGQPIGFPLPDWKAPLLPQRGLMSGRFCRLEPLSVQRHAAELYSALLHDAEGRIWTYLPYGPFDSFDAYADWMTRFCLSDDPLFFAIVDQVTGKTIGKVSYMRIVAASGCIEVGHVIYSPLLQRATAATEAMYLMMKHVFELGYRRYEWKCDALNAKSRAAAQRLGFSFEGIFRQALVYKGRNRDTAWFSVIDREWPALQSAYDQWLHPDNFDERGQQRVPLSRLTSAVVQGRMQGSVR